MASHKYILSIELYKFNFTGTFGNGGKVREGEKGENDRGRER